MARRQRCLDHDSGCDHGPVLVGKALRDHFRFVVNRWSSRCEYRFTGAGVFLSLFRKTFSSTGMARPVVLSYLGAEATCSGHGHLRTDSPERETKMLCAGEVRHPAREHTFTQSFDTRRVS